MADLAVAMGEVEHMTVVTGQAPVAYEPTRQRYAGQVSIEIVGVLTILLGAWGGIVPFVGPVFGYSADAAGSWTWTSAHAWLFLVPGATAVVGGLMMMIGGTVHTGVTKIGSLLAICAGAWFVVGPIAWPILQGSQFFTGYSTLHQFEYWIGYSIGPGVLLLCLGGWAIGHGPARQQLAAAGPAQAGTVTETTGSSSETPVAA
jgi:hypothetical protein